MAKKKSVKAAQKTSVLSRPPVVVVMGHVDHGKTTLLDAIRKTDVASGEYGGITQSIGAYQVTVSPGFRITFIDTPGHEAFKAMRSRGAAVADIAVLVVAANDSVMPQTVESIKIIQEAKIPYIVAINKVDLPEANTDKVITDLLRHNVLLENYGGDVPFVKISAKKNEGVKELLELIELIAQMNEISGNAEGNLEAVVIESKMDKSRGALATVIVKNGVLFAGQRVYVTGKASKVRALTNYLGEQIREARPGDPVEILGLGTVPAVGATVSAAMDQMISQPASQQEPESPIAVQTPNLDSNDGRLNLILRSDALGSLEAIIAKLPENVDLMQSGVGEINEADILLAKSTKAIILGFNVKVSPSATKLAESEKVLVRSYKIIYELLDELDDAAKGMLTPVETEEILGQGEIIAEFPFDKMRILGTKVIDGRLARGDLARVVRTNSEGVEETAGLSRIKSVRLGKEEVNKMEKGKECGVLLDSEIDFKVGDDIISYRIV